MKLVDNNLSFCLCAPPTPTVLCIATLKAMFSVEDIKYMLVILQIKFLQISK